MSLCRASLARIFGMGLSLSGVMIALPACSGGDEPEEPASEPSEDGDEAAAPDQAEGDDTMGDAASEETPAAEPADAAGIVDEAPATPAPAEPAAPAAPSFDGNKVVRYVKSYALNVRTGPGLEFPVKRHVKYGDKVEVIISGEWAKLGEGEYISTNRLVEKAPKKGRY